MFSQQKYISYFQTQTQNAFCFFISSSPSGKVCESGKQERKCWHWAKPTVVQWDGEVRLVVAIYNSPRRRFLFDVAP